MRVWDPRQPRVAVAAFAPSEGLTPQQQECWCVAIGNSFSADKRSVLAGYAGGHLQLFDLRTQTRWWETNVGKGVCSVQVRRVRIPAARPTSLLAMS